MAIWGNSAASDLDDFSASSTILLFDPPIPLLRGPIPAAASDDPKAGTFVLAFKDEASWRSAFESTQDKLIDQCLAGARVGCSINASNKCKPRWWKSLFGASMADYAEREKCEEREIASCLETSKEPCIKFAEEKCFPAFQDARIASTQWKGASHLLSTSKEAKASEPDLGGVSEVTTYRGSTLLNTTNTVGSV